MSRRLVLVAALVSTLFPAAARAQAVAFRGFAEGGGTLFAASKSFKAVLGSSSGVIFGGGIDVVLPQHIFVSFAASRFQKDGSRAFVDNGQVFNLGIPTTIRITPLELNAGYRFVLSQTGRNVRAPKPSPVIPYVGGGIGWHRYEEMSQFATDAENSKQTFTGFQVLGGVEFRVADWFGIAGEVKYAGVPNALGKDPNSVAAQFDEKNLGGTTFVVKALLGK